MAEGVLASWKAAGRDALRWIELDEYARRVFAGAPSNWFEDPVRYAATLAQAHQVVPSDVLSVDALGAFLHAGCASDVPAAEAVQALLDAPVPLAFLREVVDALAHRYAGRIDLVLRLRAPSDLLRLAGGEPDFDTMDEVSVALANFVRGFAGKPFAGVLVTADSDTVPSTDELEALDPLLGAVRHYGWLTALSLDRYTTAQIPPIDSFDLLLLPESTAAVAAGAAARNAGGGLPQAFWLEGQAPGTGPGLLYGRIPAQARPEEVVARLRSLGA
ncbi:MAG: hypothetical protein IT495_21985 [Gammaproteobacteria bacterium]|nr:hypothetical protein [Gammaproteobacteria bacterium]